MEKSQTFDLFFIIHHTWCQKYLLCISQVIGSCILVLRGGVSKGLYSLLSSMLFSRDMQQPGICFVNKGAYRVPNVDCIIFRPLGLSSFIWCLKRQSRLLFLVLLICETWGHTVETCYCAWQHPVGWLCKERELGGWTSWPWRSHSS